MKDLIETAKGFSTVEKEKKVQGDHKTLWEAAKNLELLDEAKKASEKELRQAIEDALDDISEGDIQLAERRLRRVLGK
jgi:hypothetical protein